MVYSFHDCTGNPGPGRKKYTDSEVIGRNETSIVLQARFDLPGQKNAGLAFFAGDSPCGIFKEVLGKSKENDLQWDLLLAPHHCSWHFLSDISHDDDAKPDETILKFLDMHRQGAIVIASCKPIKNDDDDPPSFAAKKEYLKKVKDGKFLVTMEEPSEKEPLPLHFI